jgi:hypothetical protein
VEKEKLDDQLRSAQEKLAAAEAALGQQEQADVEQAAERIRSGSSAGSPPAAIEKARREVALAKRNADALRVASEAAAADLVDVITANADEWLTQLGREAERAREHGRKALVTLEAAVGEVAAAASAASWVRSGIDDGRWDRRPGVTTAGTVAPSSARRTANSEALRVDEVLSYARELIEPPEPPARVSMRAPDAANAA